MKNPGFILARRSWRAATAVIEAPPAELSKAYNSLSDANLLFHAVKIYRAPIMQALFLYRDALKDLFCVARVLHEYRRIPLKLVEH